MHLRGGKEGEKDERWDEAVKFETDEGKAYFVPSSGGAAVWDLPSGASVVPV